MPLVEYKCDNCKADVLEGRAGDTVQEVFRRQPGIPKVGHRIRCSLPGCKNYMKRIISFDVAIHIKGKDQGEGKNGEVISTNVNGQNVNFHFIDHKHTDPEHARDLSNLAQKQGVGGNAGLKNARFDEKSGRMVVDVKSNVPDPLGMIERNKRKGNYTEATKKVNQLFKRRGKKARV